MAGASANLRQFLIIQGLPTLFFDILSLGVFPMLAPLRPILYYGMGVRAVRGFTSDVFSLMTLIPLLLLKGALDDDDDDDMEDGIRVFEYYLRKTHWGFGAVWLHDVMASMIYLTSDKIDNKNAWDKFLNWSGAFTGGTTILGKAIRGAGGLVREQLMDD